MSQEISEEPILSVRNLTVSRSGKEVLDSISLDINRGEFVGLVGPNGGGKTTLLLTILGILKPMGGSVTVFGDEPASKKNIGMVGWVPQAATQLPNSVHITVRELIRLGTLNHQNYLWGFMNSDMKERVELSLEMTGLTEMADIDVSRLSGGQFQRAVIGRALASDTEFILLDEPLVGVDRASRNSLLKLLDDLCHNFGKTILMVSHDLSAVIQTTHRIVFLEEGIQFDGSPENLPDHSQLANLRGIEHTHSERSGLWYEGE
ncbi:MAG: ABC transporter ATP-binding protein [Euryarchaeota archaeon]|nr:ABC transporter ATP-binding protein [Euryarchaeota archaeon]OUW22829.1 MAG: hypothetical protein CBD33_00640 [Euryarchaeota archaeon TMED173]